MEDFAVIQRVKDGDMEAFSLLVGKYHKRLLTFVYRLIGDRNSAEDIGQEVFLGVYKSLNKFDASRGTPFSAWLFIAARNRCISELRSRRNKEAVPIEDALGLISGEKTGDELLLGQERWEAIQDSLAHLPEPYRSSIVRSLRGASLSEIAREDGVSVGTVKSRVFRAREMMKALVKEYFGGARYEGI